MKKLVNVLAVLALASCFSLSLVACGDDDDDTVPGPTAGAGGQGVGGSAVGGSGGSRWRRRPRWRQLIPVPSW